MVSYREFVGILFQFYLVQMCKIFHPKIMVITISFNYLQSDEGKEFFNLKILKNFLYHHKITFFTCGSKIGEVFSIFPIIIIIGKHYKFYT